MAATGAAGQTYCRQCEQGCTESELVQVVLYSYDINVAIIGYVCVCVCVCVCVFILKYWNNVWIKRIGLFLGPVSI
jgi:hypothetical protein